MLNPALNDDSKHWLRREKFKMYTAYEFMREPAQVRNAVGVYVILLRNIADILTSAQLPVGNDLIRWNLLDYQHVYTGLSTAMRSRALLHLCGTVQDSAVRENLLAIQLSSEALWQGREMNLTTCEDKLTDWLVDNTIVGFQVNDEPHITEKNLIERLPSPFNTTHNRGNTLVSALMERRVQFQRHLKETGQVQSSPMAQSASQWLVNEAANHLAGWQSRHLT